MTLQLLHAEFPYIWGKFILFFISVDPAGDKKYVVDGLLNQLGFCNLKEKVSRDGWFLIILYILYECWIADGFQNAKIYWVA